MVGTEGMLNAASIVVAVAIVAQPETLSFTMTSCTPEANPLNVAAVWYVAPLSKLYVTPLDGLVTVIVPVAVVQLGCVTEVTGTEGVLSCGSIVVALTVDSQPLVLFFIKTWYVADGKAFDVAVA